MSNVEKKLKMLLEDFENMSVEEYNKLYEESQKDIEMFLSDEKYIVSSHLTFSSEIESTSSSKTYATNFELNKSESAEINIENSLDFAA